MEFQLTSLENKTIKEALKLKISKYRNEKKRFLVSGFHLVEVAYSCHNLLAVFAEEKIDYLDNSIPQYIVPRYILEKLSCEQTPQGVVAICSYIKEKEINGDIIIYLDDVSDPGNVGTIIRTAYSFGFKDIILSPSCASIYNEKVVKASQGAIFNVRSKTRSEIDLVKEYKGKNKIVSTSLHTTSISLSAFNPKDYGTMIIVLGNEANGVSTYLLDNSDVHLKIEMKQFESLNVGIAAGIILYEIGNKL